MLHNNNNKTQGSYSERRRRRQRTCGMLRGSSRSIESMSLVNRFSTRPTGVVSKKDTGARITPFTRTEWRWREDLTACVANRSALIRYSATTDMQSPAYTYWYHDSVCILYGGGGVTGEVCG